MSPTARPERTGGIARRRLIVGSGAAAVGLALAACSQEETPPVVQTGEASATPTPVADADQFTQIMKETSAALTAADEAKDPAKLAPRIVGSAAEFRTRAYEIIAKIPDHAESLATPSAAILVPATSVSGDFPRTAILLVADAVEGGNPFFIPFQQADARSDYATWGWARQLGGVDMPSVEDSSVGATAVAADADGLLVTPADALALYAAVLSNGDGSDPDDKLASDPFAESVHQGIQDERAKLNANVPANSLATIHESYSVHEGEFAALRSDDGGAIVIGTLRSSRTITVVNGATLRYADPESELVGKTSFTKEFVRDYGEVVALHVPTADSGAQVQPIGASKMLLGAHGE
ncbi:hypothetical protein BRM3_10100 [Brachybacterium huguangmaarense]|uniref:Tat pathway signal protein n=1 Tax=Brachybacterium huguangmaarense TaxID=1652028 RepID=A0ABY6FZ42_9MICO|nr:hypothetical protein [Brachybacterium huguangmaarense]UYG15984.1 hypothetical protein BRM3_10100 [Brachybacterium huguangmaarense]